jgi:putative ABC transport system permease protein
LFMSALGVLYGLTLGVGLSLVLIYVINRQSFNWSIDLSVPWGSLAALSGALIAAVTLTAVWSGRAALGEAALRAVREDW